jgi:hypothetical protein
MPHLTTQRAQQNRRRASYRAKGLCPCGKALAQGRALCPTCLETRRTCSRTRLQRLRPLWKSLGICVVCGCREAMPQRAWCGVCSERNGERKAA